NRLLRRPHMEVREVAPFEVAMVPKRIAEEVQACAWSFHVHDACLITIQLQPHPTFERLFYPVPKLCTLIAREHDEVVAVPDQLGFRPLTRPFGAMEEFVEPMQEDVCQKWRNDPTLRR